MQQAKRVCGCAALPGFADASSGRLILTSPREVPNVTNYQFALLAQAVEGDLECGLVPPERVAALQGLISDGYLDPEAKATELGRSTYRVHVDGE